MEQPHAPGIESTAPAVAALTRQTQNSYTGRMFDPEAPRDKDGLDRWIRDHRQRLYSLAQYQLRTAEEAEEAVQEASILLYQNLHKFRHESSFLSWALSILRNCCLRIIERRRLTLSIERDEIDKGDSGFESGVIAKHELERCLDRLPAPLRAILTMLDIEHLDYDEIATALKISKANARQRVCKARKLLRSCLGIE